MSKESSPRVCAHCLEREAEVGNLCQYCSALPRCEVCEVFFDGLVKASEENPRRCEADKEFELFIKFNCLTCEGIIPLYIARNSTRLNYTIRGNFCPACCGDAKDAAKELKGGSDKKQFIGYLALIKGLYDGGRIGKDEWEHAVRMNRHDVTNWSEDIDHLKDGEYGVNEEYELLEGEIITA